jgi:hypothetical protein
MMSPGAKLVRAVERTVTEKLALDTVKSLVVNTLNNMLAGAGAKQVQIVLSARLNQLVNTDVIKSFTVEVDLYPGRRIKHVDYLPITALPGDPLIKTQPVATQDKVHMFEVAETYEGIVISSDGAGNGVILQRTPSSEVIVKCRVQIWPTPNFTLIEIRHDI